MAKPVDAVAAVMMLFPAIVPMPIVRRRRVDLQDAGRIVVGGAREIGAVSRRILDRRPVQAESIDGEICRILSSRYRVAEGERPGAGAADIARAAGVIESERGEPPVVLTATGALKATVSVTTLPGQS